MDMTRTSSREPPGLEKHTRVRASEKVWDKTCHIEH